MDTVAQQIGLELMTGSRLGLTGADTGTHQVTDRLVFGARHIDRHQFAGTQEACELDRISSIGLDPITGMPRDQGRRDNDAVGSRFEQVTVDAEPARPSLIHDVLSRTFAT